MPLRAAANSIVCTEDNNALLRRLFGMTSAEVQVESRSSGDCRAAYARCEQCLHDDRCQVDGTSLTILSILSSLSLSVSVSASVCLSVCLSLSLSLCLSLFLSRWRCCGAGDALRLRR